MFHNDVDSDSDAASQQQDEDWDDWGESGEDADDDMARSLFDSTIFPSVEQTLAHDAAAHKFDLRAYLLNVCYQAHSVTCRPEHHHIGGL